MHLAHRWAFERYVRPLKKGLIVRHKCDSPSCQNLSHMEPGTHADNMKDMKDRGRVYDRSGASNPNTRLSLKQVKEIRASRESAAVLASRYGLRSVQSIYNIRLGITWRD